MHSRVFYAELRLFLGVPLRVGLSLQVLAALRAFRYYPSRGSPIAIVLGVLLNNPGQQYGYTMPAALADFLNESQLTHIQEPSFDKNLYPYDLRNIV